MGEKQLLFPFIRAIIYSIRIKREVKRFIIWFAAKGIYLQTGLPGSVVVSKLMGYTKRADILLPVQGKSAVKE